MGQVGKHREFNNDQIYVFLVNFLQSIYHIFILTVIMLALMNRDKDVICDD